MFKAKLVSFEQTKHDAHYTYENTDPTTLAEKVMSFFSLQGYSLEKGVLENGVYGIGSAGTRFFLGGLVKRYKFNVSVSQESEKVRLSISKGMSGVSGGLIGMSKMKKEFNNIVMGLKELTS